MSLVFGRNSHQAVVRLRLYRVSSTSYQKWVTIFLTDAKFNNADFMRGEFYDYSWGCLIYSVILCRIDDNWCYCIWYSYIYISKCGCKINLPCFTGHLKCCNFEFHFISLIFDNNSFSIQQSEISSWTNNATDSCDLGTGQCNLFIQNQPSRAWTATQLKSSLPHISKSLKLIVVVTC